MPEPGRNVGAATRAGVAVARAEAIAGAGAGPDGAGATAAGMVAAGIEVAVVAEASGAMLPAGDANDGSLPGVD